MSRISVIAAGIMASICGVGPCSALDMNVAIDKQEKLVYVNMWGDIVQGDDDKFRSLILPYLRTGHLIWQVNIFTGGGNVGAAMGLGDQIRLLQTRTVTAYNEAKIIDDEKVPTGRTSCIFSEQAGPGVMIKSVEGYNWCTCASACFLAWASGATRDGGHVGIHRLYWKGSEFGNLPLPQARAQYEAAQANYTAYLKKIDIPQTIVDRLFATDSHNMYYLTWPEMELMQSTPYLEEMTYSRCGKSKVEHMSRENNWTMTEDPQHINCYRGILKELMREGVSKYLANLGETAPTPATEPLVPGKPVGTAEKYWNHNGSSLRLEADKSKRRFVFIEPREGLREVGVTEGMVAFEGRRAGNVFEGTAYVFSQRCGAVGYQVKGPVSKDERNVTMHGYAPYVTAECKRSGGRDSVLVFELVEN